MATEESQAHTRLELIYDEAPGEGGVQPPPAHVPQFEIQPEVCQYFKVDCKSAIGPLKIDIDIIQNTGELPKLGSGFEEVLKKQNTMKK